MNWRFEWVEALPQDVFDQLVEMLKKEAEDVSVND